jgi:hypothetical protein
MLKNRVLLRALLEGEVVKVWMRCRLVVSEEEEHEMRRKVKMGIVA